MVSEPRRIGEDVMRELPAVGDFSLGFLVRLVEGHRRRFPSHGENCACLDPVIARVRALTTSGDARAQASVDHVLRTALGRIR